jgi:uncharacterized membrane protein YphA (DoxX/SURF4 family)
MLLSISPRDAGVQARLALALRVGLGTVFIIGGVAKLARLLSVSKAQGIVDEYVGPLGYINQTFLDWLFSGQLPGFVTPWSFLTALSAFELVSGVLLVAGLFVRPLAVVWALLLWSFVVSLPVVTTPGVTPPSPTYTSPAMFVQIRDIALSGFFFVLYNLGAGARSLDALHFGRPASLGRDWEPLGLLLRLSLGAVFLIGGLFAGFSKIATFGMPGVLLAVIGLGLVAGVGTRYFALAAAGVLVWFITAKLAGASSAVGYLNSVKREFALLAAAGVLAAVDGGRLFALDRAWPALRQGLATYLGGARRPPAGVVGADKARS